MNLEIRLDTQSLDGTLIPSKISTNPLDNFTFPGNVSITGTVTAGGGLSGGGSANVRNLLPLAVNVAPNMDGMVLASLSNSWGYTTSMSTSREGHLAVVIPGGPNAGKVLVIGGANGAYSGTDGGASTPLSTCEIFDPATGLWTSTGSLVSPRYAPTHYDQAYILTTGPNTGNIFITANQAHSQSNTACQIYDVTAGTWSVTAGGQNHVQNFQPASVMLQDGRVLLSGGSSSTGTNIGTVINSTEIFDPTTGLWTNKANMVHTRNAHSLALLQDGTVLCSGGQTATSNATVTNTCEIYDPVGNTWTATGNMANARRLHATVTLQDGTVLVIGTGGACERFDPGTGTWSAAASLPNARTGAFVALQADGTVVISGGDNSTNDDTSGGGIQAFVFDPTGNTWTAFKRANMSRCWLPGLLLANGDLFAAGGNTINSTGGAQTNTVEIFSTRINTVWNPPTESIFAISSSTFVTVPGSYFVDTTASFVTIQLPPAVFNKGKSFYFQIINGSNQCVLPQAGISLDLSGAAGGYNALLLSDGTTWQIVGGSTLPSVLYASAGITALAQTNLGSLSVSVGSTLNGGVTLVSGDLNLSSQNIVGVSSLTMNGVFNAASGAVLINADGSADFASNTFQIDNLGNLTLTGGTANVQGLLLTNTGNSITMTAPSGLSVYSLVWPNAQGAASTVLTNDGAGNLSWAAGGGGGSATYHDDQFTYSGTNVFTLTATPDANSEVIVQNGLTLAPTTGYTVSGTTLTVLTSLTAGDVIQAKYVVGAAGSTPAGANTQIQFNNSGAFGASSAFVWTGTAMTLGGSSTSLGSDGSASFSQGNLLISATDGALTWAVGSAGGPWTLDSVGGVNCATLAVNGSGTFSVSSTGNLSINGGSVSLGADGSASFGTGTVGISAANGQVNAHNFVLEDNPYDTATFDQAAFDIAVGSQGQAFLDLTSNIPAITFTLNAPLTGAGAQLVISVTGAEPIDVVAAGGTVTINPNTAAHFIYGSANAWYHIV